MRCACVRGGESVVRFAARRAAQTPADATLRGSASLTRRRVVSVAVVARTIAVVVVGVVHIGAVFVQRCRNKPLANESD
jgi:hypothetical protein